MGGSPGDAGRSFHYRSAPIYALTVVVGLFFLADIIIGLLEQSGVSTWTDFREPFGYRLALLAAVLGGARILYQTLEGLFEGRVGADLALTIACLAAIVLGEHTTAALVVFIALCGESLEGYTVDRAQRAIRGVFRLCPPTARVLIDGQEHEVPIESVEVGQVVVVRPGERIPTDGKVTAGESSVDQSALTGESLPVDRQAGDEVYAGTLNQFGAIEVETLRVGEDTTLSRVVQLVAEAAERKAPLERAADRYARLFLPVVLGTALLTVAGWWITTGEWRSGVLPALSVLVVACPCPLILATPSAVMAAMAWLARSGVVVKGSAALEQFAQVDTIAFDKTGTLTEGQLQLGSICPVGPLDETDLLRTAAIVERRSEHLIGRLICREAEVRGCVIPGVYQFAALPGFGVSAEIPRGELGAWAEQFCREKSDSSSTGSGRPATVLAGSPRLMRKNQIELPDAIASQIDELDRSGQTPLVVAVNGNVAGVIGVRDTIRSQASAVLRELTECGVERLALLSGDRSGAVSHVSEQTPVFEETGSELLPADKATWIQEQMDEGRCVAMVGDGVNDAPALATANVGIALGGVGSDLAAEAGDLILMGDPLRPLPGLLRLSRQLVRTIRQSIYLFAFGMNGCGMVLGATGILNPPAAAVFHEVASLAVMLSALRLLWFERWETTWLGRWTQSTDTAVEWLAGAFSPSRLVFGLLDRWSLLVRLTGAVVALVWFLSGVVRIGPDEQAVVRRFGRYQTTLSAGLYWRWPEPFESIQRERVDEIRTVEIGFRSANRSDRSGEEADPGDEFRAATIEWTSEHSVGEELRSDESLAMTGDEVPVELTAEIHYRIKRIREFAFASEQPAEMMRAVAESSIRRQVARFSLDDVLTRSRGEIETACAGEIAATLDSYRLGVELTGVSLLDVHPPRQVVPAYRQVADALELQQQLINEAEAYYARTVLSAAGENAIRTLSRSAAQNVEPEPRPDAAATTGSIADWKLSQDLWRQLTTEDASGEMLLSGEAAARLHVAREKAARTVETARGSAARFESLLTEAGRSKSLSHLHLFWNSVEKSLSDRPLTIVDPDVTGRQHMLLVDPDEFSKPAFLQPMLSQPLDDQRSERPLDETAGGNTTKP